MARLGPPNISREECERRIEAIHECLTEGYPLEGARRGVQSAKAEAARRLGISRPTLLNTLEVAEREHGLRIDASLHRPKAAFSFDPLPGDGEMEAPEIIEHLKAQSAQRVANDDAKRLYRVRVSIPGPIGLAFFGDPHVDSPGCDWNALDRDVRICRETEGVLAVNVGDSSDNWVGRLMALYANADVTAKQALKLVEWLLGSLPWLITIGGNHDLWHTETADPIDIIHRMRDMPGLYQASGARLQLNLPGGATATAHIRHDFPGRSQFNPSHALVRETLFGYRDHILACGHRHQSGHMAIWHNDPPRLCHGFRVGSYKVIDPFQHERHFKLENWAPSMMAVIDPDYAGDPVRFVRACYSLEEGAEYLKWRRQKWSLGKRAA